MKKSRLVVLCIVQTIIWIPFSAFLFIFSCVLGSCCVEAMTQNNHVESDYYESGSSFGENSSDDNTYEGDYDSSDPYFSANDHDNNGKISGEEYQDAFNQYVEDYFSGNFDN